MKGASRGLEGGLRRASRGLQGGLRRASRGLEKGFKGASRGLQALLTFVPPPRGGTLQAPLEGYLRRWWLGSSPLHHEQVSVHFVHIADWEDQAHIATFGDAPAKWTVYCVQFPRSRTFHLDTAAWNCHTRVDIPWQQLPHPVVFTAAPIPFHCTNPKLHLVCCPLWSKRTISDLPSIYWHIPFQPVHCLLSVLGCRTSLLQHTHGS